MTEKTASEKAPASGAVLAVLFLGVLMGALDIAIVGPALPAMRAQFAVDERSVAWVFTIYVLFNLMGAPIMAKLSDRVGRRLVYTLDVGLFALGSLIVATSTYFEQLVIGRAVQALGASGIFPVASAVIGDTFAPERRGRALGLIGAVFGVAFLLGPLLAALLLRFSWHWLFLINLPVALLLMIASWRLLPGRAQRTPKPFDWAGTLALSTALSSLALGLTNLDSRALGSSLLSMRAWPLLLLAAAATWLTVKVEKNAVDPVLKPAWFATRQVKLVALFAAAAGLGEAAMVFIPDLAVSALRMTAQSSSYMTVPVVLALAIGSPAFGRALDRLGPKPVIVSALSSLALGAALIALMSTTRVSLSVAGALVGLGLSGLLGAPLRYVVLEAVAADERASAQGILTAFTSIGMMLSGVLIGAIAASSGGGAAGDREAFGLIAIIVLVMLGAAFGLRNRRAIPAKSH